METWTSPQGKPGDIRSVQRRVGRDRDGGVPGRRRLHGRPQAGPRGGKGGGPRQWAGEAGQTGAGSIRTGLAQRAGTFFCKRTYIGNGVANYIERRGWQNSPKLQMDNDTGCRPYGVRCNHSALPLWHESSHGQCDSEWAWLASTDTFLPKSGAWSSWWKVVGIAIGRNFGDSEKAVQLRDEKGPFKERSRNNGRKLF